MTKISLSIAFHEAKESVGEDAETLVVAIAAALLLHLRHRLPQLFLSAVEVLRMGDV